MHKNSTYRLASITGAALLTLALLPSGALAVTPNPPITAPTITSANTTTFTVGSAGSFTVTTTGTPAPALTESGALPSAVTFHDNGDGTATLAGTPAAATNGTYPITITADNGATSNATQAFTLTVDGPAAITSANSATFTVGVAGSFTVHTTGTPTPGITTSAGFPGSVSLHDNGDGTATISGTPVAGDVTSSPYTVTLTAHNGIGLDATQSFTLTVQAAVAPHFTSANNATFTIGVAGSFTVQTAGGLPIPVISETGSLPSGVTLTDNHNGSATLAGTPVSGTAGSYPITLMASNVAGSPTQAFTLTVNTGNYHLAFVTQPGGGAAGVAWSQQPVVEVLNSLNQVVTSDNSTYVNLTISTNPAGGVLTCTSSGTYLRVVNGIATFSGCYINVASSSYYTLGAASFPTWTPTTSSAFYIGGSEHLAFLTQPGGGATGAVWSQQPVVEILNSLNQVVTTDNSTTVYLSIATNPVGGTLSCTGGMSEVAVNGYAYFSGCSINVGSSNPYTLSATSSPVWTPATSTNFYIGATEHLAFVTQPGGGAAGAVWSQQPVVEILNSLNQVVTTDNSTIVYLTIATNPAGGTLSCTGGTSEVAVNGYAYFTGCSINMASSSYYTLSATSSPAWTPATSNALYVTSSVIKTALAISASSALGLRPSSGYSSSTPKYTAVGKYVTWQFAGGSVLAGQRVNVLVATRTGGVWGLPKYYKSLWADASGVVTFPRALSSAGAINVRIQWPGNSTYAVSTSKPLGAYWR